MSNFRYMQLIIMKGIFGNNVCTHQTPSCTCVMQCGNCFGWPTAKKTLIVNRISVSYTALFLRRSHG